jgi:hypothetical protein
MITTFSIINSFVFIQITIEQATRTFRGDQLRLTVIGMPEVRSARNTPMKIPPQAASTVSSTVNRIDEWIGTLHHPRSRHTLGVHRSQICILRIPRLAKKLRHIHIRENPFFFRIYAIKKPFQ